MDTVMSRSGEEQTAQPNVFAPAKLGPVTLRNRIIKAATFEASTPNAVVTDDLITYHRLPAAGGVGMTTVAYLAVSPGGRTEGRQIWWRPEAIPGLQTLTAAIHAEGAAISAQIGHAGPVADARSNKAKALAPVRFFNPLAMRFAKKATRDDITDVINAHADAARFAIEAGFDAVEIHLGHNYFASSFLSPLINRRADEFGGSLENRAKVARGMVMAVRRAVNDQIAVTAKLNMSDGVRGGISTEESLQTAKWLEEDGGLGRGGDAVDAHVLMPEYLTCEDKSEQIANHVIEWLYQPAKRAVRVAELTALKDRVSHGGASRRTADYVLDTLDARCRPALRTHYSFDSQVEETMRDAA